MSTQYRLVQTGKTASGGCSAGPRFVRACSATDYYYYYLVKIGRRFTGVYYVHHQLLIALMKGEVRTSEMSVYFNEPTRRYMPEGCPLHT
jgi:hypothetical protein